MKIKQAIALVTGASSGIGEATAERLAAAGYKVYGTSRRSARPGQRRFEMLTLDVTSDASVEAVVGHLMQLEGRIDLLGLVPQPYGALYAASNSQGPEPRGSARFDASPRE